MDNLRLFEDEELAREELSEIVTQIRLCCGRLMLTIRGHVDAGSLLSQVDAMSALVAGARVHASRLVR